MKILVVSNSHPKDLMGGAELQAYLIAKRLYHLEKSTHFCAVLSSHDIETTEQDGLNYTGLGRHHPIFIRMRRFYGLLKKIKPDIVYVRYLESFWWIYVICKYIKIPTVYHVSTTMRCRYVTFRDYSAGGKEKNALWFLKKMWTANFHVYFSRFADAFICQTQDQQIMIKRELGRAAEIIRNGLPVPLARPNKPDSEFSVIWIGKHWKNPEIFVNLAKKFKNGFDMNFVMVGTFPSHQLGYFRQVESQMPNFHFEGELSNGKVHQLLDKSHVLVNTSDYEGFSNTFIEAWMRGVPVISLQLNPDNLLAEKKIGFHSKTVDGLERDLLYLYENKTIFGEYSQKAYEYALSHHDINKTADEIWGLAKKTAAK